MFNGLFQNTKASHFVKKAATKMRLDREMKRLHGESTDKIRGSVRTVRVTLASIGTGDLLALFLTPGKLLVPVLDKLVRGERRQRVGILLADFIEDGMIGETE